MEEARGTVHLYELLEQHRETVLTRWERINRVLPDARRLSRQELRDNLPALLDDLVRAVRQGQVTFADEIPRQHATQRWAHDYDITELVAEYQLLHRAILDEWSERSGDLLPGREVQTLQGFIGEAVQVAVDAYAREHARAISEGQTHLQHALDETKAAEQQLDTVVEQMAEPLAVCDAEGRLVRLNGAARRLHGRTAEGDEAATWAESFDLHRLDGGPLPADEVPLLRALRGETVHGAEVLVWPPGWPPVRLQVNAVPLRGPDGHPSGALAIGRDVTEERRAQEIQRQLRQDAQRRAEAAQQLVSVVSHDLRTPIGVILMSAGTLLRQGALGAWQARTVARIVAAAERAQRLIQDLLDFALARLGGGIPLERAPLDLHELVAAVVDEMAVVFPDRSVTVEHRGEATGTWDRDRLVQVLANLLTNALKYSPPDSVVRVRTWDEGAVVAIEVHNAGPPIPPGMLTRLFEPFLRGARETNGDQRGVGLGLSIARSIVEAHGGAIEVRSTESEGNSFTVRLPRLPAPPAPAP